MLTRKQLEKFVATRNRSGFNSNLQFGIDADACGFSVDDLGPVRSFAIDGIGGYEWMPVLSNNTAPRLVEFGRALYLEGNDDKDTASMFELMEKAEFDL